MKLSMPTADEIYKIADRAAFSIGSTRSVNTLLIENAIRHALDIVVDHLDIQIPTLSIDLTKS